MTDVNRDLKYKRCMVLAGGGSRFGYYLGMHAAAVDAGRVPDLLLATCGGALAGSIIAGLPDTASRKAWLMSPQMYAFFSNQHSGPRSTLLRALTGTALRYMQRTPAVRIPDLYRDYLFEMPSVLPLPSGAISPALAIVGGKLLFGDDEVGLLRGTRPLYQIMLFGNERIAALADGAPAAIHCWTNAISSVLQADTTMAMVDAVRISITDMFYFKAQQANGEYYTGGAIDLMPVELAHRLAHHVTMEIKQPYDQMMAIPALRAVFGIDGNARMKHVHAQHADTWIDTSDAHIALGGTGIQKRLDWLANRIQLIAPASYDQYVTDVEMQWRYGYERAQKAYQA